MKCLNPVRGIMVLCCVLAAVGVASAQNGAAFRPPAVPLIAHDPYFSVWSMNDRLTDDSTKHWTGAKQDLIGLARIDDQTMRFMGRPIGAGQDAAPDASIAPAMTQSGLEVTPTRTTYQFDGGNVRLTLTFLSPQLANDLDVLSRPVTYLTAAVRSLDGRPHRVALYFDASSELAVNTPDQEVRAERAFVGGLYALRVGTTAQPILQKAGDNLRIDWGYFYLAAPNNSGAKTVVTSVAAREAFAATGAFPIADDTRMPRRVRDEMPVLACSFDLGAVQNSVERHLLLAYDDLYSIQLMRRNLRPYWRRGGMQASDLLRVAERDYRPLTRRCAAFDAELLRDAQSYGGEAYARLIALSYRQALAAHKLVIDDAGNPLHFSKENFSNGCIATVDVIYPAAPLFLLLNPQLVKAQLAPVLDYAASPRWKWPFAPHDLGTYPRANGQVYGGGERTEDNQMPVEESGNMLIMLAALARIEGNAEFSRPYWPQLTKWANYLREKGMNPENQLSTDDFAGHLAHNTNLSIKAIVALGSYAQLCAMTGHRADALSYRRTAQEMAQKWGPMAADGDHYKLAFDKPDTWSQKYNLVWDKLLGFNLFPADVARRELAFYQTRQNKYGLPLDNRRGYTKLDWVVWTATLADTRPQFESFINPLDRFMQDSPSRVPLTDWFETGNARQSGFQARSVVGGVFIRMLNDPALWRKWAMRAPQVRFVPHGPYPEREVRMVVPTSQNAPLTWRYATEQPGANWFAAGFDDANWKTGAGGFGTAGTPGAVVRTQWNTSDIWLRRTFALPADFNSSPAAQRQLFLWSHHDEDIEVYLNGVLAATAQSFTGDYEDLALTAQGKAALRPGDNTIAVHCHQTTGGQYVDVGLARITENPVPMALPRR